MAAIIRLEAAIRRRRRRRQLPDREPVVDATGLPIGRKRREDNAALIATLGLNDFPHAQH
ncbi:MAG TPA: hypothetical protein VM262_08595 [Acidimicrobiales bacterium]|nr:hypothetical protein [Acidimicrobiales bacterium]